MTHENAQLVALIDGAREGLLDPVQTAALQSLIVRDGEARRLYVESMLLAADLRFECAGVPAPRYQTLRLKAASASAWRAADESSTPTLSRASRRSVWYLAALIMLAAALLFFFLPTAPRSALPAPHANTIAMLSDAVGADWGDTMLPTALGSELSTGRLTLHAGTAQIMFHSGAVVDLTGPCDFELTGLNRGLLRRGTIQAYIPVAARGFVLATPSRVSMIDLGTEFASIVEPSGRVELHVLVGEVELRDADNHTLRRVTSGFAAAVQPDGTVEPLALDADRFEPPQDAVRQTPPPGVSQDRDAVPMIVADYADDFAADHLPAGWRYLWNAPRDWHQGISRDESDGAIWDLAGYRPLFPAGGAWTADGDRDPTNGSPARFLTLTKIGGHPGRGMTQPETELPQGLAPIKPNRRDRFAIAAWTADHDGFYAITHSALASTNEPSNGLNVRVFTSYSAVRALVDEVVPADGAAASFDADLGYLRAGQTIYVAVGPNGADGSDSFTLDFSIAFTPVIRPAAQEQKP
ncbi:MAG: hypothetical protein GC162_05120 [Planctomycetes bacterium]|nr:hypothetical protein [Planctomycetota bacterium]